MKNPAFNLQLSGPLQAFNAGGMVQVKPVGPGHNGGPSLTLPVLSQSTGDGGEYYLNGRPRGHLQAYAPN